MTEKRFGFEMDKNCYKCIVDIRDKKLYTDKKQVVDLLNELYEENKKLLRRNGTMEEEIECLSDENGQLKARIQLLSTLLDNADTIIDLSNNGMAKAFWRKRNNEVEQEYKMKYKKGDDE